MSELNWYESETFRHDKFQAYWDFKHNFELENYKNACELSFDTAWDYQQQQITNLKKQIEILEESNDKSLWLGKIPRGNLKNMHPIDQIAIAKILESARQTKQQLKELREGSGE